jgi:hypothetical protein
MIKALHAGLLALAGALPAAALSQQLVSESVQGNARVCNYSAPHSLLTRPDQQTHYRTGIGQNCPATAPIADATAAAPPTAPLLLDQVADNARRCTYGQWGSTWSYELPLRGVCPPAAGMIEAARTAALRR